MEDVLDLYEIPHDPQRPVVCFDEKPYQLIGDVRPALPAKPGRPLRQDSEYARHGVAEILMACEPRAGQRHVWVTEHRTKIDFAEAMEQLVKSYASASRIRVVLDNLSTHKPGALYDAFPPEKAHALLQKLEFHYTPKHGSWLNMAEIEFSALSRQCLARRISDIATLRREVDQWARDCNRTQRQIHWRLTTARARTELGRCYPKESTG